MRGFDSNEQTDDSVTIFDPAFTPGDASYLRDHAGYFVLSVRTEVERELWMILRFKLISDARVPG